MRDRADAACMERMSMIAVARYGLGIATGRCARGPCLSGQMDVQRSCMLCDMVAVQLVTSIAMEYTDSWV